VVVEVLKEEGIDITGKPTQAVFDLFKAGRMFHYVITVCDESSAEKCPIFPGMSQRLHWSFTDPSRFVGTPEEKRIQTRAVKEEIKSQLVEWLAGMEAG
jgi:arsenate reductase